MFRSRAERKVAEAGFDPARLPPGQTYTEKWPVLHAGDVARYGPLDTWTFRVFGEVEEEVELSWEQFNELPRSANVQDIHCVTRWSHFDLRFEGVHPNDVLALARPKPTARFVVAHAEALVARHRAGGGAAVASRYEGTLGVPAVFGRTRFPELLALRGDQGARALLRHDPGVLVVDWPDGALDIDTPGDLATFPME